MKQVLFSFFFLTFLNISTTCWAQSNPKIDRPVQECISNNKDKVANLQSNFSIGSWLGKLISHCDKLQASSGTAGGPLVIAILEMEKDLDDLIAIAGECTLLNTDKIKYSLLEMKKIYQEKQKVDTYKIKEEDADTNLFEDSKELKFLTLPRSAAGKIKNQAEKVKKELTK